MLDRTLAVPLRRASLHDEPVLVQGPHGAGKTTLLRREYPAHTYVSLDDARDRMRARSDPRGFLARLRGASIIDDLHRAPELIAALVTAAPKPLLLASSRRLALPFEAFELYPATKAEREGRPAVSIDMLGRFVPAGAPGESARWPASRTFLERDVRELVQVRDLDQFEEFFAVVLERSGAVLDQQAIADACGLSHRTVVRWLGVLEDCFLTLRLQASAMTFGRRVIRSPKLHVLGSESLESRAVWEIYCNARHAGIVPDLSYWRDSNGFEIPLVVQPELAPVMPVCIAGEPNPADVARLHRWMELAGVAQGAIIGGKAGQLRRRGIVSYSIAQL